MNETATQKRVPAHISCNRRGMGIYLPTLVACLLYIHTGQGSCYVQARTAACGTGKGDGHHRLSTDDPAGARSLTHLVSISRNVTRRIRGKTVLTWGGGGGGGGGLRGLGVKLIPHHQLSYTLNSFQ